MTGRSSVLMENLASKEHTSLATKKTANCLNTLFLIKTVRIPVSLITISVLRDSRAYGVSGLSVQTEKALSGTMEKSFMHTQNGWNT